MRRSLALLVLAVLAGCRAGQPAVDPFLNSRVPPPNTGDITPIQPGMTAVPGQPTAPVVTVPGNGYAPPAGGYNYPSGSIYGNAAGQGYGGTPTYPAPTTQTPGWNSRTTPAPTTPGSTTPPYGTPPAGANPAPAQPNGSIYNRQSSYNRSASSPAGIRRDDVRLVAVVRADVDRTAVDDTEQIDASAVDDADAGKRGDPEIADSQVVLTNYREAVETPNQRPDIDAPDERPARDARAETQPVRPRRSTRGRGPVDRGETYGFDPHYAWLHGRLEYSQVQNQWKLRYIPLDGQTDTYGGSVVLAEDSPVSGHQPGEFVSVSGAIASAADARDGFAPTYRAERIERLQ